MAQQFDLIVLGTGTAARVAAMRCRSAGWSVTVLYCRPFGGACALRSYHPKKKKMLVGEASAIDHVRRKPGPDTGCGSRRTDIL